MAATELRTPKAPPETDCRTLAAWDGWICRFWVMVAAFRFVWNVLFTKSAAEPMALGRDFSSSAACWTNRSPNTATRIRDARTIADPVSAAASPRLRPRRTNQAMPGSIAAANNHASTSRKTKWPTTPKSHSASMKTATRASTTVVERATQRVVKVVGTLAGAGSGTTAVASLSMPTSPMRP